MADLDLLLNEESTQVVAAPIRYIDGEEFKDVIKENVDEYTETETFQDVVRDKVDDYTNTDTFKDLVEINVDDYVNSESFENVVANSVDSYVEEHESNLVTKDEFNTNVPFKFGITDDGKYGYIQVGADTVTPFKSGETEIPTSILNYYKTAPLVSDLKYGTIEILVDDAVKLTASGSGSWACLTSKEKIDLTNFNTLSFNVVHSGNTSNYRGIAITRTAPEEQNVSIWLVDPDLPKITNATTRSYEIDVSDVNEECYITFFSRTNLSTTGTSIAISDLNLL